MSDVELVTVWDGARGWVGSGLGRGALLPEYSSATSLTEAMQERAQANGNYIIEDLPQPGVLEKRCFTCRRVKPAHDFYDKPAAKDGLFGSCKRCVTGHWKQHRSLLAKTGEALHEEIIRRAKDGQPPFAIAKRLGTNVGEVKAILKATGTPYIAYRRLKPTAGDQMYLEALGLGHVSTSERAKAVEQPFAITRTDEGFEGTAPIQPRIVARSRFFARGRQES